MAVRKPLVIIDGQVQEQPAGDTPAGAEPAVPAPTSGATAKYWRGDKSWRDFATDVRAAVLTGLSTATNVAVVATDTVLAAVGKLQAQIGVKADAAAVREKLSAPRTYYVRTDGSDSNDGLSNTAGSAFLTIQKAIDAASALDNGGHNIIIQVADGNYPAAIVGKSFVGSGQIIVQGNVTTPANVTVAIAGTVFTCDGVTGTYLIRGFTLSSSSSACLSCGSGSAIRFSHINFGASGGHIATSGGVVLAVGPYSITGGAAYHANSAYNGLVYLSSIAITLVGTPAFSLAFARSEVMALISVFNVTITGAATGKRYIVADNSVIFVNGAGATYLPGNAAGTNDGTGVYR